MICFIISSTHTKREPKRWIDFGSFLVQNNVCTSIETLHLSYTQASLSSYQCMTSLRMFVHASQHENDHLFMYAKTNQRQIEPIFYMNPLIWWLIILYKNETTIELTTFWILVLYVLLFFSFFSSTSSSSLTFSFVY